MNYCLNFDFPAESLAATRGERMNQTGNVLTLLMRLVEELEANSSVCERIATDGRKCSQCIERIGIAQRLQEIIGLLGENKSSRVVFATKGSFTTPPKAGQGE